MNPFAHFAFGSKSLSDNVVEKSENPTTFVSKAISSPPSLKRGVELSKSSSSPINSTLPKKKKKSTSNKSSPEIMATYWIELKNLTTNYPFAVLLTGVLGAQTRDVVTVGVMRQLASSLGGDICPLNICSQSFDALETTIKRLNYCHKKTRTMMDLAAIFRMEPVPSTLHGLKTIPGVGPVISEIILRIAFGVQGNSEFALNNEHDDGHQVEEVKEITELDTVDVEEDKEDMNNTDTDAAVVAVRKTIHDLTEDSDNIEREERLTVNENK